METIILNLIWASFGFSVVYFSSKSYMHKNDCEKQKAISLACMEEDRNQRLLEAPRQPPKYRDEHDPFKVYGPFDEEL